MTFVGTNAIFFAAVNLLKLIPYFALDQFTRPTLHDLGACCCRSRSRRISSASGWCA